MKKVNLIFRTITWCVVIIFTTTTIVWSAPSGVQARGEGEEKALPAGRQGIVQAMAEQYQKDQKIHDASSTIPDENVKNTPSKQITSKPPRGAALYKAPLVWRLSLPENYGTIKIRWIGGKSPGGTHTQQGAVAIIQDAHCNYEAQMNIAKIIHHMSTNVQKDISVGLEGATGAIDTSIFRNYPDHDIRDAVSRYFVREGKITGAEYASITSDGTVPYFGVEDEKLYLDNYKAFLSIVKCRGPLTEEVEAIEGILSQLRTLLYSPELKEFEKAYFNFREENLTFFEYADILLHQAKECAIDLFEYPNISLFREVKEREGRINFEKLSEEINAYLAVLCGRLQSAGGANEELGRIDRFTKQYNEGAIPNHDYFNYLVEQGFKHKVNLLAYTNLYEYSQYLKTYKRIDKQALRFERRALEKSIKTYLAQTTTTNNTSTIQELLRLSERLHFVQSLIEVKIFNQDIEQFENERYSFRAKEYVDFVIRTAPKHNIPYNLSLNIAYLDRIIPKVYDFYAASMKRDEVMVENLLEKSAPLTLLIAGGFHTAGLCKQLEERGISYIVIAPRITQKQSDQDEIYLSRMLGEPDAFDVMMMELLKMPERQSLTVSGMPVNTSFFAESFMQMLQRMLKYFDAGGQSLHDPTVPENPSLKLMRIYFNNEFDMLSHTLYDLYGREYDMDATLDPAHKLYRDEIDFKHLTSSEEVAGDVVDIQLPAISEISGTTVLQDIVKTLVTLQRGMSITLRIQQEGSTQSMLVEVSVRETQEEETTVRDDTSPVYDALSVSDERGLDAARDTFFVKYENDDAEIKGIISSIEDDIEKVKSAGIAYTEKQTQKADVTKEMESLMSRVNSATARIEEIIEQTKDVEEPSNMAAHVRQMRYVEIRGSLREFSTVLTALEMTALEEEKFHVYLNKHQEIKEKLVNFIFQHNAARKQFLEENQSFVYMRRNDEPFRDGYHKRIAEEIAVKVLSGNYYGDLSSDSPIGSIHKDIVDMGKYIQRAYEIDAAKERMPEGAALLVEGSNIAAQKVFSGVDIARAVDAQEAAPVEAAQLYERSELDEGLRKARGMIFQQAIDKAESPDHAVFVGPARSVKAKKRITIDGSEEVASSKVGDLVHYTEEELRAALNAAHQMAQQRSPAPAHAGAQIKGGVIGGLTIGVARFIARTANIVSLGRIVDNKVLRDNLEAVLSAPIVETGLFVAATQNAFTAAGLSTGATLFGGIGTGIVFALAHIFNSRDMIKDGWNAAFSLDAGTRAEARGRIAEESKSKDIDWPAVGLVAIVNVIGIMTGVWGVVGAGFFHIAVNSYRERQQKAGAQIAAEQIVDVEAEVIKDAELISFEEERLQRAEQVRKLSKSIEERALDDAEENIEAEIVSIHTQLTNLKKTLETLNELRLSDQTAMKKEELDALMDELIITLRQLGRRREQLRKERQAIAIQRDFLAADETLQKKGEVSVFQHPEGLSEGQFLAILSATLAKGRELLPQEMDDLIRRYIENLSDENQVALIKKLISNKNSSLAITIARKLLSVKGTQSVSFEKTLLNHIQDALRRTKSADSEVAVTLIEELFFELSMSGQITLWELFKSIETELETRPLGREIMSPRQQALKKIQNTLVGRGLSDNTMAVFEELLSKEQVEKIRSYEKKDKEEKELGKEALIGSLIYDFNVGTIGYIEFQRAVQTLLDEFKAETVLDKKIQTVLQNILSQLDEFSESRAGKKYIERFNQYEAARDTVLNTPVMYADASIGGQKDYTSQMKAFNTNFVEKQKKVSKLIQGLKADVIAVLHDHRVSCALALEVNYLLMTREQQETQKRGPPVIAVIKEHPAFQKEQEEEEDIAERLDEYGENGVQKIIRLYNERESDTETINLEEFIGEDKEISKDELLKSEGFNRDFTNYLITISTEEEVEAVFTFLLGEVDEEVESVLQSAEAREFLEKVFTTCSLSIEQIRRIKDSVDLALGFDKDTSDKKREKDKTYKRFREILNHCLMSNQQVIKKMTEAYEGKKDEDIEQWLSLFFSKGVSNKDYFQVVSERQVIEEIMEFMQHTFGIESEDGYRSADSDETRKKIIEVYGKIIRNGKLSKEDKTLLNVLPSELQDSLNKLNVPQIVTEFNNHAELKKKFTEFRGTKNYKAFVAGEKEIKSIINSHFNIDEQHKGYQALYDFLKFRVTFRKAFKTSYAKTASYKRIRAYMAYLDRNLEGKNGYIQESVKEIGVTKEEKELYTYLSDADEFLKFGTEHTVTKDLALIIGSQNEEEAKESNSKVHEAYARMGYRMELIDKTREYIQDKKERGETVTLNALKADMTLWRQKLQNNEWIYEYSYDEFYQRFNIPLYIVTDSQISLREGQKALYYGMPRGSYVGGATALGKTIGLLNASIAEMRIAMQEGKDIEDLNIPAQMIMADVPAAVDKYVNGWTGFNIRHEYLAAMGGSTIVNLSEIFAKHDWNELEKSLDKNNLVYVVDPEQNGFFGLDINRMERENPELKKKLLAKLGNIKIDESDRYFSLLNQYITSNPTGELTFPKEKLEKFWTFLNELKELSKMKDFWLKDDNAYQVLTDENELKKYTTLSKKGEPKLYRMFFYRNGKDLMVKTSADLEDYLFKRAKKLGIEKEGEIESLISSFAQEPAYEGSGDYAIYNRDVSTTENAKGGSKSAAKHSDKVLLAGLFYKAREHMVEIYYGKGAELIPIAEGTEVREDELIVTNKDGKFKIIQGEGGYLAELEIRATKFNKEIDEKIARTFGAEREALVKRKEKERQWLQKALQETHERFAYECPEFQNLEKSLTTDSAASTVLFTQSEAFNRKNQQKIDLDALRKEHHSKDNASIKNLTGNEKGIAQFRAQIWVERDVEGKERIYIKTPNGMALSSYKTKEGKIISLNGDGHEGAAYLAFDQLQELEGEDVLILGNATIRYEKDTDTGIEQIIVKRKTIAAATSATFSAFEAENTGNAEESVDPLTWNLHNLKNFGKMSGRKALQEIVRYHTNVMARPETIDANAKNHNENVEWYENEEQAQQALYDRLMGLFDMRLSGVVMDETNGISRGLIHELKRANIRYMKFGERIAAAESIKSDVASMNAIVNRIRTAKREKDNTALAKEYDHLRNNDMFAQMSLWVNENTKLRERGKDLLSFIEFQEKCTEEEIKNELAQYEKVTTADERQSIERRLEQMQDEISIVDEEVEYHYKLAEKSETDEVLKVQSNTVIHITTNISPTVVNAISKVTSKAGIAIIGTNVETIKQGWDTITNIVKNALFLGKERTLSHTQAQQAIQNEYNKAILDEFHALDDAIAKEKYEKTFFYKAGTSEERDMYECITVKVIKGRVTIVDSYELAAGATVHFLNKERTRANLIFPLTLFANATNRDLNELIQMRGRIARQDGVLGHVFLYFDKKKAKDRIEEMMKHEVIKDTLKQTMRRFSDKFQTSLNDPFTRNELTGGGDGYIKHSAHDVFAEALEYFKKAERVGINNLLESELMILNAACTSVHNSSSEPALHKIREALGSHMDQYLNELMGKKPDGTLFGSTIEENGVERPLREEELSGVQRIMMYGYRMYKNPDAQDKADMKAKALRLVIGKDRVTQSVVSELGREIFVLENLTFHLREFIDNDTAHFNSEAAELDNVIVEQKTEEEKELAIVRLRQMKRKIARLKEYQRQFSQHGRIVEDIHRAGIQGEFDALHDSINVINENVSRDDIPQHVENLQRTLDTLMDYDMANTKNHTLARRALTQLEKNYAVVAEGIKDAMGTNRDLAQANTVIVQAIRKAHIFLSDNTQEKEQIEVAREEKFESALAEKAQALPFFRHTSVADTLHKATDLMGDTTKAGWVQARFQTGGEEAAKELPTVSKVEQQTGQHFVQNEIKKVQNNRREAEEGTEGMKERLNEFENRVKDINKEMDTVAESPIARSIEAILQLHEIEDSSHISDLIGDLYQKHETTKDILNNELDKFFTKHGIEKDDIKKSIIDLLDIFRMQSEILDKDDMVNQFNNTLTEKGQAFLNMVRSFSAMVIPAPGAAPPDEDDMVYFLSLARMFGFISQDEEEKKEIAMGTILNVAQKLVTIKNSEINFKNISASLNKVRITVEALRVSAGTAALQEADFLSIIRSRNDPLTGYSTPFNVRLAEGIDQKQGAMKSLTHYIRHQKTQARTKQWQREKMQNLSREIELRKKHRYGKWKTTTVRAHYGIEKLRYGLREARELLNSKIGGFLPYGLRNPIDQMKDPRLIDLEHMVRNADRQHPPSTLSLYAVHNNKLYNDIKRIREVIMQYSKQYPNVPALQAASLGKMHISDVLKLHKKINVARSNLLIRRKDSNDAPLLTEQAMQKAVEAVYADMIQEAKQAKWQKRRTVLKTVYTVSIFIGFIVALLTPGVAWGAYQIGNVLFSYLNFAQAAAPFWGTAISGYMGIVLTALIGFLISGNQFTALLNNKQTQRIPGLTKVFNTMGKGIDKVNALGKKEKEDKPLTIIRSPLTVMQFIPRLRRRLALTELRDLQTKISDETLQATLLLMRTKLADTTVPVTVEAVKNIRDILRKMRDYVNAKKEADKYPDEDKGKEKDQMAQMMAAMGQEGAPEDPEEQKKKAETEKKKEIAKKALETAQTALHAALTAYDTGGKLSDYVKLRHELDKTKPADTSSQNDRLAQILAAKGIDASTLGGALGGEPSPYEIPTLAKYTDIIKTLNGPDNGGLTRNEILSIIDAYVDDPLTTMQDIEPLHDTFLAQHGNMLPALPLSSVIKIGKAYEWMKARNIIAMPNDAAETITVEKGEKRLLTLNDFIVVKETFVLDDNESVLLLTLLDPSFDKIQAEHISTFIKEFGYDENTKKRTMREIAGALIPLSVQEPTAQEKKEKRVKHFKGDINLRIKQHFIKQGGHFAEIIKALEALANKKITLHDVSEITEKFDGSRSAILRLINYQYDQGFYQFITDQENKIRALFKNYPDRTITRGLSRITLQSIPLEKLFEQFKTKSDTLPHDIVRTAIDTSLKDKNIFPLQIFNDAKAIEAGEMKAKDFMKKEDEEKDALRTVAFPKATITKADLERIEKNLPDYFADKSVREAMAFIKMREMLIKKKEKLLKEKGLKDVAGDIGDPAVRSQLDSLHKELCNNVTHTELWDVMFQMQKDGFDIVELQSMAPVLLRYFGLQVTDDFILPTVIGGITLSMVPQLFILLQNVKEGTYKKYNNPDVLIRDMEKLGATQLVTAIQSAKTAGVGISNKNNFRRLIQAAGNPAKDSKMSVDTLSLILTMLASKDDINDVKRLTDSDYRQIYKEVMEGERDESSFKQFMLSKIVFEESIDEIIKSFETKTSLTTEEEIALMNLYLKRAHFDDRKKAVQLIDTLYKNRESQKIQVDFIDKVATLLNIQKELQYLIANPEDAQFVNELITMIDNRAPPYSLPDELIQQTKDRVSQKNRDYLAKEEAKQKAYNERQKRYYQNELIKLNKKYMVLNQEFQNLTQSLDQAVEGQLSDFASALIELQLSDLARLESQREKAVRGAYKYQVEQTIITTLNEKIKASHRSEYQFYIILSQKLIRLQDIQKLTDGKRNIDFARLFEKVIPAAFPGQEEQKVNEVAAVFARLFNATDTKRLAECRSKEEKSKFILSKIQQYQPIKTVTKNTIETVRGGETGQDVDKAKAVVEQTVTEDKKDIDGKVEKSIKIQEITEAEKDRIPAIEEKMDQEEEAKESPVGDSMSESRDIIQNEAITSKIDVNQIKDKSGNGVYEHLKKQIFIYDNITGKRTDWVEAIQRYLQFNAGREIARDLNSADRVDSIVAGLIDRMEQLRKKQNFGYGASVVRFSPQTRNQLTRLLSTFIKEVIDRANSQDRQESDDKKEKGQDNDTRGEIAKNYTQEEIEEIVKNNSPGRKSVLDEQLQNRLNDAIKTICERISEHRTELKMPAKLLSLFTEMDYPGKNVVLCLFDSVVNNDGTKYMHGFGRVYNNQEVIGLSRHMLEQLSDLAFAEYLFHEVGELTTLSHDELRRAQYILFPEHYPMHPEYDGPRDYNKLHKEDPSYNPIKRAVYDIHEELIFKYFHKEASAIVQKTGARFTRYVLQFQKYPSGTRDHLASSYAYYDLSDEILKSAILTSNDKFELITLIGVLRDDLTVTDEKIKSEQDLLARVSRKEKTLFANGLIKNLTKEEGYVGPCTFDISILNDVFVFNPDLAENLLIGLKNALNELENNNIRITLKPVYSKEPIPALVALVKNILEKAVEPFAAVSIAQQEPCITTDDNADVINAVKLQKGIPIGIKPSVFVPVVKAGLIQLLTLDTLFARIAHFVVDQQNKNITEFAIEAIHDFIDFSAPIYLNASDAAIDEIKEQSFAIAA